MFLRIKLDKSHNAVGHTVQLCRNDEYHVSGKEPHVISQHCWDYLTSSTFYIVFPIHQIHIIMRRFTLPFGFLSFWSMVVTWELKMFHCGLHVLQSSSNIFPSHCSYPWTHGSFKGHPCRVSSCKNFPHSTNSDNPGLWALSVSLSLSLSLSIIRPFPHPWTVWKVFYPLPALSFEAVIKVIWQMLRVEVYY